MREASDLRRAVVRLGQKLRTERSADSPTPAGIGVLGHLYRHGDTQPRHVAKALGVQPQSLTRVLHELDDEGLIVRRPDPGDGRAQLLAITERGRDALLLDMSSRDRWLTAALGTLSETERGLVLLVAPLLERLADHTPEEP